MKVYKQEKTTFKRVKKPVLTMEDIMPGRKKPPVKAMPTFPKGVSGMPHCIARSALFKPMRRGPRRYFDDELIESRNDVEIRYTGKQLDMSDSDVFLQAVRVAQGRPAGELCFFERAAFLKAIGRKLGSSSYNWLESSLNRLQSAKIQASGKKVKISTVLVASWGVDEETDRFFIQMPTIAAKLFADCGHVDLQIRILLSDVEKWLQDYISSHAKHERHFITVENLYSQSGSKTELKHWKSKKLKPALAKLQNLDVIRAVKIGDSAEWVRV